MSPSKTHPSDPRAAHLAAPDELRLSHLPGLIRPTLALARRGRAVIGLTGPDAAVRALAAALLAFGLPEDAALMRGVPGGADPAGRADLPAEAVLLDALPLFPTEAEIRAFVDGLPDETGGVGEPKDPTRSRIFALAALVADPARLETLRLRFLGGISWTDARAALAGLILRATAEPGRHATLFAAEPEALDDLLTHGAARALGRLSAA